MITSEDIVSCARGYLKTPFRHQGRVKFHGVDCAGLVICVARDLKLSDFDYTGYPRQPIKELLLTLCRDNLDEINSASARPGDIVLFKISEHPQHLAILGDYRFGGLSLIHAYSPAGEVIETVYSPSWGRRAVGYFRYKGV